MDELTEGWLTDIYRFITMAGLMTEWFVQCMDNWTDERKEYR